MEGKRIKNKIMPKQNFIYTLYMYKYNIKI